MNNNNNYCKNFFNESEYVFHPLKKAFDLPFSRTHYVPSHEVEPEHVSIEIEFDFEKELVKGITSFSLLVKANKVSEITLDAKNLTIQEVIIDGASVKFENTGKKLQVFPTKMLDKGNKIDLIIHHSVEKPAAGVYFVKPTKEYPNKHLHVWTQSQDEDASFFIPCFDHPSFKQTSEVKIKKIPKEMIAISNGMLIEKTESFYHYKLDVPHSIYLLSIVVGNFKEIEDSWDGIPVNFYVHPSRVEDGHRSFDKTKKMVQFFSEFIGVRYPYPRYGQVAVSDFIFGGMENTSITTQTDLTLHDERAHIDFSSDSLVAHELAHQWFGDLLTCKEWSHAWLNESFATYFDALFKEHDLGKDEFDYAMFLNAETYFSEDSSKYRRPIVYNNYVEPIDLFDSHLYPGGSWRLHMLRKKFSTQEFRKVINFYVENNKFRNVETIDLQRAFESVTGENVDQFFDQWLYKAGYPCFDFKYSWKDQSHLLKATISQTQNIEENQLFTFETEIKVVFTDKTEKIFPISIKEKSQTIFLYLDKTPLFVSFDHDNKILKKLNIISKPDFLKNQISYDSEIIGRIYAVQSLLKEANIENIQFVGKSLVKEPFWGVQSQMALTLGSIGGSVAEEFLLSAVSVPNPKARKAVVLALKNFPLSNKSAEVLLKILTDSDPSYYVEAEACKSLGYNKHEKAFEMLQRQLTKESHNDIIRQGALEGIANLKSDQALKEILEWTKKGNSIQARIIAIESLAKVGKLLNSNLAFEELAILSQESNFRIKMATISAFRILGDKRAIYYLKKFQEQEVDGRFQRVAYNTIQAIQKGLERPQELDSLKDEIAKLKEENLKIKESISKLHVK
jgi:aminopeptidase N